MPPWTMPNSALGLPSRSNSAFERRAQRRLSSIDARASRSVVRCPAVWYGVHSSNCMTMSLSSTVWICTLSSGVSRSLSPLTGDANCTPCSLMRRPLPSAPPRLQTWKPPLSVRIGRAQPSKRCRPPKPRTTSSPGRSQRWKVLPRMICAPMASRSRGSTPLTLP